MTTDNLQRAVLVLNASYEAISICTAKRALKLVCKGAALVQEPSGTIIRTGKLSLPLPAVIRLITYRHVPRVTRAVSRKSIMIRDSYTCQYCVRQLVAKELTLDHVVPRAKGGKNTWENLATACYPCNNKKGARTPAEAGMVLVRPPRSFGMHAKHKQLSQDNPVWQKFLFV